MLDGRRVIITGGGRGLGREMALAVAESGADVLITAAREKSQLHDTVTASKGLRGTVRGILADVTDVSACKAVLAAAEQDMGGVDVLINNAGRGMRLVSETYTVEPVKFWETEPETWRTIIDINVNGAFNMARIVTPVMVANGFGKIINISTSAQTMVRRGYSPYGPSKAALEAASRVWHQDLAGTGVTVNVLLPGGATDTALIPEMPEKRGADGMLLAPQIMRAPTVWLCSDAANNHSGERYIARLWDDSLPPDEAAAVARQPSTELPVII